ncbi:MAG TPA: alpha/beta hydrolase [Burkholderiales bacterium]|nr:alpha/beta hydrolase [Burkholderiales bacterium]
MLPDTRSAADITFRESGRADAPALVLLHGIGSTSAGWRLQYEPLGAHFRVVAWDAPGYGGSRPLEGDAPPAEAYAQALARLMDALGVREALIGTSSWGTATGVVFARLHPQRVRGLVLGGPSAGWGWLPREERERRLASRVKRVRTLGVKRMREDDAGELVPPGTRAEVLQWIRGSEGLSAEGYAQAAHMLAAVDVAREAASVKCPARVVAGELDKRTPPESNAHRIAAALANGKLVMLPECGHLPHLEYPEKFNAVVLELAQSVSSQRAAARAISS